MLRGPTDETPSYVVMLTFDAGAVADIRDYRYVPYITLEASIALVR